jgi:hypothetical protein
LGVCLEGPCFLLKKKKERRKHQPTTQTKETNRIQTLATLKKN